MTIRKNLLRSSLWIVQLWLRSQLFVSPASNQRWIILRSPTVLWITWRLLRRLPDYQQKEICGGDVSRIWSEFRKTNLNPPRRKRQRLKCTESKRMRWNIDWGNLKTRPHQDRVIGPLHPALLHYNYIIQLLLLKRLLHLQRKILKLHPLHLLLQPQHVLHCNSYSPTTPTPCVSLAALWSGSLPLWCSLRITFVSFHLSTELMSRSCSASQMVPTW